MTSVRSTKARAISRKHGLIPRWALLGAASALLAARPAVAAQAVPQTSSDGNFTVNWSNGLWDSFRTYQSASAVLTEDYTASSGEKFSNSYSVSGFGQTSYAFSQKPAGRYQYTVRICGRWAQNAGGCQADSNAATVAVGGSPLNTALLSQLYDTGGKVFSAAAGGTVRVRIFPAAAGRRNVDRLLFVVSPYTFGLNDVSSNGLAVYGAIPASLREALAARNIDVAVLDYSEFSSDQVQSKGRAFAAAFREINAARGGAKPSVVIGLSLGGVVARYGLRLLEQSGYDHAVRYYVSHDAPHGGAHVPLGLQQIPLFLRNAAQSAKSANSGFVGDLVSTLAGALQIFGHGWDGAEIEIRDGVIAAGENAAFADMIFRQSFENPAARQLLIQNAAVSGYGPHPDFVTLQNELASLGLPRGSGIHNIAVVNGSITGVRPTGSESYVEYASGSRHDAMSFNAFNQAYTRRTYTVRDRVSAGPRAVSFVDRTVVDQRSFWGWFDYEDVSNRLFGDGWSQYEQTYTTLGTDFVYDNVPCSTLPLPQTVVTVLAPRLAQRWPNPAVPMVARSASCFIPTASALGGSYADLKKTTAAELGTLRSFDEVWATGSNSDHTTFDAVEEQGVLSLLGIYP